MMTIDELLHRLDAVRPRGMGRWSAGCPAHADRSPSLAIKEGEWGLLVKCWAGCTLDEITAALSITVADLFYESDRPTRPHQNAPRSRSPRLDLQRVAFEFEQHADSLACRADAVLHAATGLNITPWADADLDQALSAVASAYDARERVHVLLDVAMRLRARAIERGRVRNVA